MEIFTNENPPSGFYVYAYIRETDDEIAKAGTPYYVGKGKNKRAWGKHTTNVPSNLENIVIIAHNLTELWAFALERRLIKWYGRIDTEYSDNTIGILLNRTDGGEGTSGAVYSEESCLKISIAHKGKSKSPEHKAKISASIKRKIRLPHSVETRAKISNANKGNSPANKGKQLSESTKQKISNALKGRKGKPISEENKAKISIRSSKTFEFIDPTGNVYIVTGKFKVFCIEHGLTEGGMRNVANQRQADYKGWKVKCLTL